METVRRRKLAEHCRAGQGFFGDHKFGRILALGGHDCIERALELQSAGGEDKAGSDQVEDVAKFGEVRGKERVASRDGRERDACVHGSEAEERVFEIVAGENREGAIRGEAAVQESLRDVARQSACFGVADATPCAGLVALGIQSSIRGVLSPVVEAVGELDWKLSEGLSRLNVAHTFGRGARMDAARTQPHLTHRCHHAVSSRLAKVLPSRASRLRSGAGSQSSPYFR